MPAHRFGLILIAVILAAGLTVWIGTAVAARLVPGPEAAFVAVPLLLALALIGWRLRRRD